MYYIFEDNPNAALSRLLKVCFSVEESNHIIFTCGHAQFKSTCIKLLRSTSDKIVVFQDLVPGNRQLRETYMQLRNLSRKNDFRIIILPIVCMEYCFIRSVSSFNDLFISPEVHKCISKVPHILSEFANSMGTSCSSFERYCKCILRYLVADCISLSSVGNNRFCYYMSQSCLCDNPRSNNCTPFDLIYKSVNLIRQLPCAPSGAFAQKLGLKFTLLSDEDLWKLHSELILEFNEWSCEYRRISRSENYYTLPCIK